MSGRANKPKFPPVDTIIELEPKSPTHNLAESNPALLGSNEALLGSHERRTKHAPLLDAVESGELSALKKALATEKGKINLVYGPLKVSLLHLAAYHHPNLVPALLKNGADVKVLDTVGRSAFHLACSAANSPECIKALIDAGADVNQKILISMQMWNPLNVKKKANAEHSKKWHVMHSHGSSNSVNETKLGGENNLLDIKYPTSGIGSNLPVPDCLGRTGLHQAVKATQPDCVEVLLEAGAIVDVRDQKGLTPLLLAGAGVSPDDFDGLSRFEKIVQLLVDAGANVNILNPDTGTSALHHAAARCSLSATQLLVKHGAIVDKISSTGATALHEAAHSGAYQVLEFLLDTSDGISLVNKPDHVGLTPLHKAAFTGNRGCLELLLQKGGHLAILTHSGTSVLDAVFMHVARPYQFLTSILDNCVQTNNISVLDRAFKVNLDFSVLAPHGCERQTSILREIFNSPKGHGHSLLLRHPLLETFLWLKWQKLRVFFFFLLCIYGSFLTSLCMFVIVDIQPELKNKVEKTIFMYLLIATSVFLLVHIFIQAMLRPLFYVREFETWVFAFCGSMSLIIVSHSTDANKGSSIILSEPFLTNLTSIVLLVSWTELMLLIGRFPTWGNYALMFYTVLRNVLKVMLTFVFIVIGFTLSFYVQFHECQCALFNSPWQSFVKTIVMMAGEFEYKDLFEVNNSTLSGRKQTDSIVEFQLISRIIFLAFVILTTIVMMNLMVGLAVSDIQAVQAEGHFRRLLKQAQFVEHLETIISHGIFTKCLPKCILHFLSRRRRVVTELTLQPSAVESKHRYPLNLPHRLIESCVELAVRQKAISQLKMDEELLDTDPSSRYTWFDMGSRERGSEGNLFGVQQQAVLEDMMLRVFEELQDLKNLVQMSGKATPLPLPRTLSRKESRRLNLPRSSGNDNRTSRLDDFECEVQGAHCVLRKLR